MLQRWLVVIIGLPLLLAALLLCPDWVTVIVVCGIAAAAAYELLHTAGKKVPKCVYAFTILAAVAQGTGAFKDRQNNCLYAGECKETPHCRKRNS